MPGPLPVFVRTHYIINLLGEVRRFCVAKEKRFALQGFSLCSSEHIISYPFGLFHHPGKISAGGEAPGPRTKFLVDIEKTAPSVV